MQHPIGYDGLGRLRKLEHDAGQRMIRIFVVEDEVVVSEDIQQTVRQLGYEVAGSAESGVAALLAIEKAQPDLVLMDIKLAGRLDGIQTAAVVRKRWTIPIIYLTSYSDENTLRRATETAPHGYLLKPFSERDLHTAIEVAIRKRELEQKLEQRERWFSTTLESVGDAVIATDPDGRITFMNAIAEEVTGWKKADAQGKAIDDVFRVISMAADRPLVSKAIRDGFHAELPAGTRLTNREGANREVDESSAPIMDESGRVLGKVVVFRDITERRRLEQRLVMAERLASIATMAAGMAHEINNPLAATLGNVEFATERIAHLMQRTTGDACPPWMTTVLQEVNEALSDARAAGTRVRRIVADLKKFSRTEEPTKSVLDLPDVLQAAFNVTHHLLRKGLRFSPSFGTTPLVEANEGQLVQVFANLIANAIQAGDGAKAHAVDVVTFTDERGRAVVEVRDEGCGISPQNLSQIFEPFFTTKTSADGLGLGLSICRNTITACGGDIDVQSRLGAGTTFRVSLSPATDPNKRGRPISVAPPTSKRARVLVIDDDEAVARAIHRIISQDHDVHFETDPRLAVVRIAQDPQYDVILCDLTMPAMNGMDVYEAVCRANPEMAKRIVFLTGGVVSTALQDFLEECPNLVLPKPFSTNKLLAVVANHL